MLAVPGPAENNTWVETCVYREHGIEPRSRYVTLLQQLPCTYERDTHYSAAVFRC